MAVEALVDREHAGLLGGSSSLRRRACRRSRRVLVLDGNRAARGFRGRRETAGARLTERRREGPHPSSAPSRRSSSRRRKLEGTRNVRHLARPGMERYPPGRRTPAAPLPSRPGSARIEQLVGSPSDARRADRSARPSPISIWSREISESPHDLEVLAGALELPAADSWCRRTRGCRPPSSRP